MQAHTLSEVGNLGTVSLRVCSGTILPIFIEIGSYLTDKEQKISWHSFFETRCTSFFTFASCDGCEFQLGRREDIKQIFKTLRQRTLRRRKIVNIFLPKRRTFGFLCRIKRDSIYLKLYRIWPIFSLSPAMFGQNFICLFTTHPLYHKNSITCA